MMRINKKGQALVEILIGLFVAGILITSATAAVVAVLRSNVESKNFQIASSLSQQLADGVKTVAEADWHNIYSKSKGSNTQYFVAASGTQLAIIAGTTTTVVGNISYTQFFSVENVNRLNGDISAEPTSVEDPSTQKIVSHAQWTEGSQTPQAALTVYLTRWRNSVSQQNNWSGGSVQQEPVKDFGKNFSSSTGIDYSSSSSICIQGISCP